MSLAHEPFLEALGEVLTSPPALFKQDRGACFLGPIPLSHGRGCGRDGGCQRHCTDQGPCEPQDLRAPERWRVSMETTVRVQPPWKPARRFLEKLKTEPPHGPAGPLLGVRPEEVQSPSRSDVCTPRSLSH